MEWVATAVVVAQTAQQWTMITLIDFAPQWVKRRLLANEYTGEALDRRVTQRIAGGWQMAKALYHMNSVNAYPGLALGDVVPETLKVVALRDGNASVVTSLCDLTTGSTPLMINFG